MARLVRGYRQMIPAFDMDLELGIRRKKRKRLPKF
jgi:hypothetical protein